jgi:hypothetical protein
LSGPEKDTLCSEVLDEDTLIPGCGWTILSAEPKKKEKSVNGESNQKRTDWVEELQLAIAMLYSSTLVAPNKTFPSVTEHRARKRNLRIRSVVIERGRRPRSDHRTPVDEHEVFDALDGQPYVPRPVEPAVHMVPDVLLEHLYVNSIFMVAPLRKGQKRSATPARIDDHFGPVRMRM